MKKIQKIILFAVVAILAVAIIGVLIYNNSTPVKYNRQLDLGNKYLAEQDYEQAVLEYNIAIKIDPMNISAYLGKTDAYLGMDDYVNAITTLKESLNITSDTEVVLCKLEKIYLDYADIFITIKEFEEGINLLKEALVILPDSEKIIEKLEELYINQAERLMDTGLNKQAITLLEEGYQLIQADSLKGKIIKIIEINIDNLISEKAFDNIESMYIDYEGILPLSDAEIADICTPIIYILEKYTEYFSDSLEYHEELSYLYYMVQDFQKCKVIREQGYKKSAGELFAESYVDEGNGDLYNEYGKPVYQSEYNLWTEYGEDGRVVHIKGTDVEGMNYEMKYERGSDGRVTKIIGESPNWLKGGQLCSYTLTYMYTDEGKCWIRRTDEGKDTYSEEVIFDKFGMPIKEHYYYTDGYEMLYYYGEEYREEMYLDGELVYSN